MKSFSKYADYLVYASFFGLVFAAYGAFSRDILWLASTQWILISGVIVTYAVYLKLSK